MVVRVISGVLAAVIVPNVRDRADDARSTAARTDVTNVMQALKLYRLDNQRYHTAQQGPPAHGQAPGPRLRTRGFEQRRQPRGLALQLRLPAVAHGQARTGRGQCNDAEDHQQL